MAREPSPSVVDHGAQVVALSEFRRPSVAAREGIPKTVKGRGSRPGAIESGDRSHSVDNDGARSRLRALPRAATDSAATEMRRAMARTGLDQAELSALTGVSTRTLRRWRRGQGLDQLRAYLVMVVAERRAA